MPQTKLLNCDYVIEVRTIPVPVGLIPQLDRPRQYYDKRIVQPFTH